MNARALSERLTVLAAADEPRLFPVDPAPRDLTALYRGLRDHTEPTDSWADAFWQGAA